MNRFESKTALNTKTATNAWELKILIVGGAVSRTSAGKTWPGLYLKDVARETKSVLKKMLHQKKKLLRALDKNLKAPLALEAGQLPH